MPVMLEEARVAASSGDRRQDILNAVDHLLRVHDDWENDPKAPDTVSEAMEKALLVAFEVCEHGDIPSSCRQLCTVAIPRLRFEWEEFASGDKRRHNGTPMASFWASFKGVVSARKEAVPFIPRKPEPAKYLHENGVPFTQIARQILGYVRPDGTFRKEDCPFLREDGSVDMNLLQQEIDKPNSVLPKDWIHPLERERQRQWEREVDGRLVALTAREENEPNRPVEKMSVEDYLMQGALADVVARVKMIPISEVMATEARLKAEGKIPTEDGSDQSPSQPQVEHDQSVDEVLDVESFVKSQLDANKSIPEISAELKKRGVKKTQKELNELAKKIIDELE